MNGGLYRSTHAADGNPRPEEGVTVVSVDQQSATATGDQALPPENLPPSGRDGGGSTAGQSAIMAIGSMVSRVIGFVRTALIGMAVGTTVGDAYTSAQFLPNQIYELLLGGILSSVLVPLLVRRRKSDPDGGQAFTQKLLTFAVVSLGVATVLVVSLASAITAIQTGGDSTPAYRELVTHFAYLILPIIFFTGLSGLAGAVLNVRGHFAAPMWAPILNNIVVIATCGVFILCYGGQKELTPENITGAQVALIGGGTLLGIVVQALGLLPALRKVGFRWRWSWDPRSLGLREIGQLAGWMLVYAGANQLAVFLVVRILSDVTGSADSASILAFNYVFLLTMMAHGIVGVSVMTALLPKMSAAAAEGRFGEVSADLTRGIKLTSAALAPIVVVYAVLSAPIAVFLFQGGRFSNANALATGTVLAVAAFAVIPLSISYLCTYAFYALQGNKTVALINVAVVAVRIGAYFTLAAVLKESLLAAGMTAGNAISYLLSALISLTVLRRRIGRLNLGTVLSSLIRVAVAAGIAAALGLLVLRLLPGDGEPAGRIEALVQLVPTGAVILIGYLVAATLLRVQEVSQVVGMVRRKIGR
ncbi:murein biosynthesis integral membrane protein MurJ [Actinoplanes teichomyceticus]|uniref:Putative peptidoglycan lipid II flippase n=1 Tax=Actinoplanes teichomyceticus TaxID=1867 RepID=A0A561WRE1_ACTTI|nr:murein biosynthesis integral membrane protein MurJ [Actinoplanes teichomyceticus]TWG26432.1 putative peptidoglycan lipid II flippase [Actinoplanes teichomyceticus]GIF11508.1 lipid II flippase MurJ [Actinoplanes teichomyceticus]